MFCSDGLSTCRQTLIINGGPDHTRSNHVSIAVPPVASPCPPIAVTNPAKLINKLFRPRFPSRLKHLFRFSRQRFRHTNPLLMSGHFNSFKPVANFASHAGFRTRKLAFTPLTVVRDLTVRRAVVSR